MTCFIPKIFSANVQKYKILSDIWYLNRFTRVKLESSITILTIFIDSKIFNYNLQYKF